LKEKFNIDEDKKQNIYCVLLVLVLILLAFGDQIALHFLEKNPNPNNSVFGESDSKNEADYQIDFLENLDIKTVLDKIDKKESFVLLSSRDSCQTCDFYLPILKEVYENYQIKGYYLNRGLYETDSLEYLTLQSKSDLLKEHLVYTPYLMFFSKGELKDELVGRKEKKDVEDFIIRNNLANI